MVGAVTRGPCTPEKNKMASSVKLEGKPEEERLVGCGVCRAAELHVHEARKHACISRRQAQHWLAGSAAPCRHATHLRLLPGQQVLQPAKGRGGQGSSASQLSRIQRSSMPHMRRRQPSQPPPLLPGQRGSLLRADALPPGGSKSRAKSNRVSESRPHRVVARLAQPHQHVVHRLAL